MVFHFYLIECISLCEAVSSFGNPPSSVLRLSPRLLLSLRCCGMPGFPPLYHPQRLSPRCSLPLAPAFSYLLPQTAIVVFLFPKLITSLLYEVLWRTPSTHRRKSLLVSAHRASVNLSSFTSFSALKGILCCSHFEKLARSQLNKNKL